MGCRTILCGTLYENDVMLQALGLIAYIMAGTY